MIKAGVSVSVKGIKMFLYGIAGTLYALAAFAAGEEHGGRAESYTFIGDWLPRLINFAILAGFLVYFARKPFRDFFRNRTAEIAKSMQESKEARERAIAALGELEQKVKEAEAEARKMADEAVARAEQDKQALIAEGRKVAEDIKTQVKSGIDTEVQKARTALAVDAALLSIELAEGTIKDKITKQDHDRILKEYINKVGGRG